MMKCVIIDDEPLARECIRNYIQEVDFLQLVGEGSNPIELSSLLEKETVDLIFLDIQMPKMNGVDFLKMNAKLPMVIFTTAYPSYALEGYELDVLDYLLKPVTFKRFFQAASKAKDFFRLSQKNADLKKSASDDFFFVKCNNKFEKIFFDDILFVQALQNYVTIYTTQDKFITLMNLKSAEEKLTGRNFMRIHKSYIISLNKVTSMEGHEIQIQSHRIPISRNFRKEVSEKVLGDKLW